MTKKEQILYAGIILALLYLWAAITFYAQAEIYHYEQPCRTVGHIEVPCD